MTLTEELVHGYASFKNRVEELKSSQAKLFVLFTGSKVGGSSWCPDCNDLDEVLKSLKAKVNPDGYLLTVDVGGRDEWKDKANSFRTDPNVKISSIPTLVLWGTQRRLSEDSVLDVENLEMLFCED